MKPGNVVLDLGAGTGILGLMACRAGAARVYAIEHGGMIDLARALARANGVAERIEFIKGLSTRVDLPERVDVVLADPIGRFGFETGVLEYFRDARDRFLKPGGRTIPARIDLWVAPVEHPEAFGQIEFWNARRAGFDVSPARSWAVNTGYPLALAPGHLLGEPSRGTSLDLSTAEPHPITFEVAVTTSRRGTLHGVGGWFSAQLSPAVTMSNSPLAPRRINRRNVFFPIDRPVTVGAGEAVRIAMHILPGELVVTWTVEVGGMRFRHSTLHGMLITREDLRWTHPETVPKLSPWGEARRSILDLCDGAHTVARLEAEVYRRHRELFRSPASAAEFVAEVITRYAR